MENQTPQEEARYRASIIFQVQNRTLSVTEAAELLGISRKSYYEWESRAMKAMVEALEDKEAGRPAKPVDAEKTAMEERIAKLEKELLLAKQTLEVRELLQLYEDQQVAKDRQKDFKKNLKSGPKPSKKF